MQPSKYLPKALKHCLVPNPKSRETIAMANFDALNPQVIAAIDKSLGSYISRFLMIADDQGQISKQLDDIASRKEPSGKLVEETDFLLSCGYKLAQEGLILTSLILSRIGHVGKMLPPEEIKRLHAVADVIRETIDPHLNKLLSDLAPYSHLR